MSKFRINHDQLIMQALLGEIADTPVNANAPYRMSADGDLLVLPGTGSITYNARIGDSAIDLWGDHVEPAVTILHPSKDRTSPANGGLTVMSCIGNKAYVVSGEAKGEIGRVTGTHGGVEHVMVDFTRDQMEQMVIGDKIQVRGFGQGLALLDFPGVNVRNLDPIMLDVMSLKGDNKSGILTIPVTHHVPAAIMGSGLGRPHTFSGDYDIQMFDDETVDKYKLNELRFGDIVAIIDADHTYGRIYRKKSISVGVIIHSRSVIAGHGPGVTTLFTSTDGLIDAVIDPDANLINYFEKL